MTECPSPNIYNDSSNIINKEFAWNPELQGYILSAGYLGFILTLFPGCLLVGRYTAKSIIAVCIFIGSFCNLLCPVAARFSPYLLAAFQLIRGMSQGPPTPATPFLIARWFPVCERGLLATFLFSGFPFGGFVGSIISGPISDIDFDGGWPLIFYSMGLIGVLMSIIFFIFLTDNPEEDSYVSKNELQYIMQNTNRNASQQSQKTPWKAMLTSRYTYVFFVALFAQYWSVFYIITVHPLYMNAILNIPVTENGLLTSYPQLSQSMAGLIASYFSLWLNRNDASKVNFSRKTCNTLGSLLYILGMVGLYLSGCDKTMNEIFLFVAAISCGFLNAGALITAADMSPTFCGPLTGIGSTIGSLSGIILPVLEGHLTKENQTMAQWHVMFLITMTVMLVGCFLFLFFGSANIQPYDPAYKKEENPDDKTNTNVNVIFSTRF